MQKKTKILIVEDEPLIAEDIREYLNHSGFIITKIAFNKATAINSLRLNKPDLVLLDINLGNNYDGIKIAEIINLEFKVPFIYLTSYSSKIVIDLVKHTLPMGYVVKPFEEVDLFTSIEIAISNYKTINSKIEITLDLINTNLSNKISPKEYSVLMDIYYGKTYKQMAISNFISINTIKTHIQNIFEKLDTHSKTETVVWVRNLISN